MLIEGFASPITWIESCAKVVENIGKVPHLISLSARWFVATLFWASALVLVALRHYLVSEMI